MLVHELLRILCRQRDCSFLSWPQHMTDTFFVQKEQVCNKVLFNLPINLPEINLIVPGNFIDYKVLRG